MEPEKEKKKPVKQQPHILTREDEEMFQQDRYEEQRVISVFFYICIKKDPSL